MAEQKQPKFQSRFGASRALTAAQYLTENMCDRKARSKKTQLGWRFWNNEPWDEEFKLQLRHANSLLKIYELDAVIKALRTPEGKNIYSLGYKGFDRLVRREQAKLEQQRKAAAANPDPIPTPPQPTAPEAPRQAFVEKKSQLSKLRDL